jgi:glycosyltransferase involved in cell wall biosynthesis
MKSYVVNGMFMCQQISGIQRYALEVLKRIDELMDTSELEIELLVPFDVVESWRPANIKMVCSGIKYSGLNKHLWLNFTLPSYARKKGATVINLCNMGPLFDGGISVIHDIMYKTQPQFFPWKKRFVPCVYYKFMTKSSRSLVTVSEYTKTELEKWYGVPASKISVIGNGWEHISKVADDDSILKEYDLTPNGYYVSIGNISPHKNFSWVINEAEHNPGERFVVVGQSVMGISRDGSQKTGENVVFTGRISDEQIKSLMKNAKALLLPSFCEGFGIPPLEMLALGGNAIVSETSCLPEIFGRAVNYIDPNKSDYDLSAFSFEETARHRAEVVEKYTWQKAAEKWLALLTK